MVGKLVGLGVAALVVIGGILFLMSISYQNKEIDLRNLMASQVQVIEANYDKMWKVLKQKAGITDKAKDAFKEMYVPLIEGRYSHGGGQMMQWLKEHNPQFDFSLFKDLMTSVEALRDEFFQEQKKLISMSKQHKDLLMKIPSRWFLGGIEHIEIKVISSTKTKQVMESGVEDDIDLFN